MRKLLITLIFFALLLGSSAFLLNSTSGLYLAIKTAKTFLPGKLTIGNIHGKLGGPITLKNLAYKDSALSLNINNLDLDWRPIKLLFTEIAVNKLHVNDAQLHLEKKKIQQKSSSNLHLPWQLNLKGVKLKNIAISRTEAPTFKVQKLDLQTIVHRSHIKELNTELLSGNINIKIHGYLKKKANLHWNINIPDLSQLDDEFSGAIASKGSITGDRKLPRINATINANNFGHDIYKVASLNGKIVMPEKATEEASLNLDAQHLQIRQYVLDTLNIAGNFTAKNLHEAQLKLQINPSILQVPSIDKLHQINLQNGTINSTLDWQGLRNTITLTVANQDPIIAKINLPQYKLVGASLLNQKLTGSIKWNPKDISLIAHLVPYIADPTGKLDFDLDLSGTTSQPYLSGKIAANSPSLTIPHLNLKLTNTQLNCDCKEKKLNYQLTTHSEKGNLKASGSTKLSYPNILTEVAITGNNFLISDNVDLRMAITPSLKLKLAEDKLMLNGKINIPEARISPHDFSNSITLPNDVEFVDESNAALIPPKNTNYFDLDITLGDNIYFDIMRLSGNLTGKLNLKENPQITTTAQGTLTIKNGKYDAYGQMLDIESGSLTFTGGPIVNPIVIVVATKHFQPSDSLTSAHYENKGLTVGIDLQGQLKDPKIKLFSRPAGFSKADILSYLVIGEPASNATGDKAKLLLRAVTALSSSGNNGGLSHMADQMRDELGLSKFGLETQDKIDAKTGEVTHNTALVLGKYLTPKLYIGYSAGITDQSNTVKVRYKFNQRWSIQSEAGTGNGVDVFYSVAKD